MIACHGVAMFAKPGRLKNNDRKELPAKHGKLVVISGPSGVGKSTVVKRVMAMTSAAYSVSATTRARRAGEVDGRDYRFVDRGTFEKMISGGELLEWAEVFGNLYGTPAAPVREAIESGRTMILEIDVQGALQVHEKMPEAEFVLIVPPSDDELARRLKGRGSEDEESFRRRLGKAQQEMRTALQSGVYKYVVTNDALEHSVPRVAEIVQGESKE